MVARIAVYGDSITVQGIDPDSSQVPSDGTGIYYIKAKGWQSWLRIATECGFDFVPNGNQLFFAESGKATPYLKETYLPALLKSGAKAMIDEAGINDIGQGFPQEETVANCRATWAQCRAAGIMPIRMKVTPLTLLAIGNSEEALSARIAALNQALRAACEADAVPFLENSLETAPDNGIGDPKYFTPDPFPSTHPNALGGQKLGTDMAPALLKIFSPANPGILDANWLTPNTGFASGDGSTPTGWQVYTPQSITGVSQALTPDPTGNHQYWDVTFTDSSGSSGLVLTNSTANSFPPAGRTMEMSVKFQVITGAITRFEASSGNVGGTGFSYAIQMPANEGTFPGYITAESGPITLKGIPFTASAVNGSSLLCSRRDAASSHHRENLARLLWPPGDEQ